MSAISRGLLPAILLACIVAAALFVCLQGARQPEDEATSEPPLDGPPKGFEYDGIYPRPKGLEEGDPLRLKLLR
jgi:hypothetical protein